MTGLGRIVFALIVATSTALPGVSADPVPVQPAPNLDQLVRDLGSPAFATREHASQALWKLGEAARPALEKAIASGDAEAAERAREILAKFDSGIYADTPPAVLKQIREFRTGLLEKQHAAVRALVRLGEPAIPTLRLLLTKETQPESRSGLFDTLAVSLRSEVPRLIVAGQPDRAESLLALNTLGPSDAGLMDYAIFVRLRGRTASAIAGLERARQTTGPTGEAAARALVFVHHAAGDLAAAKTAADAVLKHDPLFRGTYESLLEDLGAWTELADQIDGRVNSREGLLAFRLRLAGQVKEADTLLASQKDDDVATPASHSGVDPASLALLLNDRPLDGIERLRVRRNAPHILADLLAARLQFAGALDLVAGNSRVDGGTNEEQVAMRQLYGTRRGKLLWQLGRRDASAQVFTQSFEQLLASGDPLSPALTQLIRAEVRAGRFDLACEHLGEAFAAGSESAAFRWVSDRQDGFEVLFEGDADAAVFWWRVLRSPKPPGETGGATMKRIRRLLTGTATPEELTAALKRADRFAATEGTHDAERKSLAIAGAKIAAGRPKEALATLTELAEKLLAGSTESDAERADAHEARQFGRGSRSWVFGTDERFRFWLELGDLAMDLARPRDAARYYFAGWERYPDNPVLLYLAGRALTKAGDEKDGRQRIDLAHWVALGNARLRGRFLEELISRGFTTDVRRERDLVRESAWVSELYIGNVWNQVGRASVLLKDYPAAAAANRRAIHYLLRTPGVTYVEGHAYVTVPQAVRGYTARGLLAAGKVDEAVAMARECLAVTPGNADIAISLVPELDRLGRTKEADAIFRSVWDAYRIVLRDNPESGWARFSAAWLAAACRRELDRAFELATKASELEPGLKNYKEAVAELHFRRGEREKALTLMTELATSDRRSFHYKRQLERYRTADVSSPLPEADDD